MTSVLKTKKLKAISIAEYFIAKAQETQKPVTNKKLQKLLYYAQAWHLALHDKKLFDEKIEAWIHGPAVKEVYIAYKNFGFNPITKDIDKNTIKSIPENIQIFLDEIWRVYGKYDAAYLEHLTHSEEPWQKAREGIEAHIGTNTEISPLDMKTFYSELKKKKNGSPRTKN